MEQNTNRPGGDIRSVVLADPNPALCQSACADERRCVAWMYVMPGLQGAQARCWLKDSALAPTNANGTAVSGLCPP